MNAIVLRELGDPEKLSPEHIPDPLPSKREVIVQLKASAINHRDVWIRTGHYAGIKLPVILGSDGAGIIVETGTEVDRSIIGREVVINPCLGWGTDDAVQSASFKILGLPDNGTYAEYVCVPAENIFSKPAHLTFEESAALPLAGLTAYRAVISRAKVREGETILVTGIGGGVATFALLFAKTIGASVVVTSGNDAKISRAVEIGARAGVNYRNKDWAAELLAATNGAAPDVVIDSAGGETLNVSIDLLKPGGRLVTYGATAGAVKELQVRRIFWKQLSIYGSTMGTPDEFASMLAFVERHGLHPVIDSVFPLRNAAQAHRRMDESAQFGKIVLSELL